MNEYSYNIMNTSTIIVESGASPYREGGGICPVDSKILTFVLSTQLIECYIIKYWEFF